MTRLSEFAAVESGSGFPIADQGVSGAEFPFLKVSDMNLLGNEIEITCWNNSVSDAVRRRLRAKAFPAGTVIFPKIGAAIATNKKRLLTRPCSIDNNCMGVTGEPTRVESWFLYYLFRAKNIADFASDSNPPSIRKTEVEAWDVPLPSLEEQRRIVDLLSRAESIVRMRREASRLAKEIIPALFLDMFGDPATNPKGWEIKSFDALGTLDRGRSRHRPRDAAHLYGGTYPFVQTGDVTRSGGAIATYTQTYSEAGLAQSTLWPIGTLCITIAANIAETGILGFAACFPDSVVGFLPGEHVRTDYIQQWLTFLKPALAAQAPQAAQKNINLAILKGLKVPLPPVQLQGAFAAQVERLRALTASQSVASNNASQAFQSLLAGVFGADAGRLT